MILRCFSYFSEGEDVDYSSDKEDHNDEDEISWVCCDGCNLWYHPPMCLEELAKEYSIRQQKEKMFLLPFLTNFQEFCFYTNTNIRKWSFMVDF